MCILFVICACKIFQSGLFHVTASKIVLCEKTLVSHFCAIHRIFVFFCFKLISVFVRSLRANRQENVCYVQTVSCCSNINEVNTRQTLIEAIVGLSGSIWCLRSGPISSIYFRICPVHLKSNRFEGMTKHNSFLSIMLEAYETHNNARTLKRLAGSCECFFLQM